MEIVNTGRASNAFAQACLREICYITARANAVIKLVHISSDANRISDCLSRWKDRKKRDLFFSLVDREEVCFLKVDEKLFEFSHDW